MCSYILIHVFDYGQKDSSDQMRTIWEKLVHHVGTMQGHDIRNKLINKERVTISKPNHTQDELDEHQLATERREQSHEYLATARQFQKGLYEYQVIDGDTTIADKDKISLATFNNETVEADLNSYHIITIFLEGDTKQRIKISG